MTKISFKYSTKTDAWSWIVAARFGNTWGMKESLAEYIPPTLLRKIKKGNHENIQKEVEVYIRKFVLRNLALKKSIETYLIAVQHIFNIIGDDFFKKLADLTNHPIYTKKFNCYISTGAICPYDPLKNLFMVSVFYSLPLAITTICHELMHLQFIHYYRAKILSQRISVEKFENIKEALSVLLNEQEFSDIISYPDYGYPAHKKLRKRIQKIWKKEKNFEKLIEKIVEEYSD